MKITSPYNLTPIGPSWSWRMRVLEVVGQTAGLILLAPIVWVHRATGWILERMFR